MEAKDKNSIQRGSKNLHQLTINVAGCFYERMFESCYRGDEVESIQYEDGSYVCVRDGCLFVVRGNEFVLVQFPASHMRVLAGVECQLVNLNSNEYDESVA